MHFVDTGGSRPGRWLSSHVSGQDLACRFLYRTVLTTQDRPANVKDCILFDRVCERGGEHVSGNDMEDLVLQEALDEV